LVRKERKAQQVLQVQLVQRDHKARLAQRELQDLLEVEAVHLDHKVQQVQLVLPVQRELQAQRALQVLQALQEQLDPQVQREQPVRLVLLEFLKLFMERWQFQISAEWQALRRMERLMDSRRLKVM
jgi:hypothetical protein